MHVMVGSLFLSIQNFSLNFRHKILMNPVFLEDLY